MDKGLDYSLQETQSGGNRNLLLALKRVYEAWFPPNPDLLNRIRQGLDEGSYDLDVDFLISELKTDFALLSYCIRELVRLYKADNEPLPRNSSPIEMLRVAGIERLKKILRAQPEQISPYTLENINDLQAARLKEVLISASTAEVIAEKSNLDLETGFSSGFLRQLGLALVSWNYPNIYRRTLRQINKGRNLDQALTAELGFSPGLLGLTIARQWGVSAEIRSAMGDPQALGANDGQKNSAIRRVGDTLAKICEIGEALARANDPANYPDARSDWETARREIEHRLGNDGIKQIQHKVRENCENYIKLLPESFKSAVEIQPELRIKTQLSDTLHARNRYVRDCPEKLRNKVLALYARIDERRISRDNVIFWAREILPLTGFPRGCIFLLEPESALLVPRLALGDAALDDYKPVSCSGGVSESNRVAAAFQCSTPLIERDARTLNGNTGYIACVIGSVQRAGVLYLEFSAEQARETGGEAITAFKAASQALNDCFNVK